MWLPRRPALLQRSAWASVQGLRRQLLSTSAADDAEDGPGSEGAEPAAPLTFAELVATIDQLREAGLPLEDTAAAMLLKAVAPQRVLTNKQIKQAEHVIELIKQDKLTMSNQQLQKVLDAFFASDTAVGQDSYNLLLWVLARLDVNKCFMVAGKMSDFPGVYADRHTFQIVIEACIRTKRLDGAIRFVNQHPIVRPSVELTYELIKLCYSENNVEAARVCQGLLSQLYVQDGGGKNESKSQWTLWGHQQQLSAWIAEREDN
jgi:hypothetical protein